MKIEMTINEAMKIQAEQLDFYLARYDAESADLIRQDIARQTRIPDGADRDALLPVGDVNGMVPRGGSIEHALADLGAMYAEQYAEQFSGTLEGQDGRLAWLGHLDHPSGGRTLAVRYEQLLPPADRPPLRTFEDGSHWRPLGLVSVYRALAWRRRHPDAIMS